MIWVGCALLSAVLVGLYRRLAIRRNWFDIPNQRSSHTTPVVRGAGFALVPVIIAVPIWLLWRDHQALFAWSFLPGLVVALAGGWDDVRGLQASVRFLLYGFACVISALLIWSPAYAIAAIAALGFLWWINLYNFMDGINGIAAMEAIFICIAVTFLCKNSPALPQLLPLLLIVLAAAVGFLPWNFPVARVFFGDVGSAFVGFMLGAIALWSMRLEAMTFWQWMILGGVFVVDATFTLLRRMLTGQRWYQAHRSHAYQRLADRCHSHALAVLVLLGVNIFWLWPFASYASGGWNGGACMLAAYLPLVIGCIVLQAGIQNNPVPE